MRLYKTISKTLETFEGMEIQVRVVGGTWRKVKRLLESLRSR